MSSNAALSAARRRRSNPSAAAPSTSNMQSHVQPVNRILQRSGVPPPPPSSMKSQIHPNQNPQFNRMPPHQQYSQMRATPPQHFSHGKETQPQQMQQVKYAIPPELSEFPPLPPPVKTAGPLYGIPIHPLMMFKTHDNKLSEHDLSIDDCVEQLKEVNARLSQIESSNGEVAGGDLADLVNDDGFINGVVDNIMNTTNFSSIVESVIPLKQDNEILKQQVTELRDFVHNRNSNQLECENEDIKKQMNDICNSVEILQSKIYEVKEQVRHVNNYANDVNFRANQICAMNEKLNTLNEQFELWKQKMQEIENKFHLQNPDACLSIENAAHIEKKKEIVLDCECENEDDGECENGNDGECENEDDGECENEDDGECEQNE